MFGYVPDHLLRTSFGRKMPRSVRAPIEARSRRLRLEPRKEPYWCVVERCLAVGYHRPVGGAGAWWARALVSGKYRWQALATAYDHEDPDGERVLDWRQAQAAARVWAAKQTSTGPLTVGAACERYLAELAERKGEAAARNARGTLMLHVIPLLAARLVSDLTTADLEDWLRSRVRGETEEGRRKSRDTANRVMATFKAVLNAAFRAGLVADDKAWRRVRAFAAVGRARMVILIPAQMRRLLGVCGPALRDLVALALLLGARCGELTTARVGDFDAEQGTLAVRGKTGGRVIHLPEEAVAICRRLSDGRPRDGLLLVRENGRPWSRTDHKRPFIRAISAARREAVAAGRLSEAPEQETTFYALRHTYISSALKVGVPPKAVADHCGTSLAMIQKHYSKFIPEDRKRYAALAASTLGLQGGESERVVRLKADG
jgi:integrase